MQKQISMWKPFQQITVKVNNHTFGQYNVEFMLDNYKTLYAYKNDDYEDASVALYENSFVTAFGSALLIRQKYIYFFLAKIYFKYML